MNKWVVVGLIAVLMLAEVIFAAATALAEALG